MGRLLSAHRGRPENGGRTSEPAAGTLHFASHIGQDAWVAKCLEHKHGGFFLDFGAFDGETISNTLTLEKELGWRGICVEPNPRFYAELCRNRQCVTVNVALWPQSRASLRFVDAHGLSAIETYKDMDVNSARRQEATLGVIEVDTLNPNELLARFEAPALIDYLSLDVEGAEFEVLSGLDLNTYAIALMTIEHNHDRPRQIRMRNYLAKLGYEFIEHCNDDFFFNRSHLLRLAGDSARVVDPLLAFRQVFGE